MAKAGGYFEAALAHENFDARRAELRQQQQRARREQADASFRGAVAAPAERLVEARKGLLEGARGLIYLASSDERRLSMSLRRIGDFNDRAAREWMNAFTKGGVRLGNEPTSPGVVEVASPTDRFGARGEFVASTIDPSAGHTAVDVPFAAYFPSQDIRDGQGLSGHASRRRSLYVATPPLLRGVVAPLTAGTAGWSLDRQLRLTEVAAGRNQRVASAIGEVLAAGVLATGIDPGQLNPAVSLGFHVEQAMEESRLMAA